MIFPVGTIPGYPPGGLARPIRRTSVPGVLRDGPNRWYVPKSSADFAALGLTAPNVALWNCDEASGNLQPTIGTVMLGPVGTITPLYQQTVPGWSKYFLALNGTNQGWRTTANTTLNVAAGESVAVYMLVSASNTGVNNTVLRYNSNAPTQGWGHVAAAGNLRPIHNAVAMTNTPGVDHYNIDIVHQYVWFRNATTDVSGLLSDLEYVVNTHAELAITAPTFSFGASGSTAIARIGQAMVFRGAAAEQDWASYLGVLRGE